MSSHQRTPAPASTTYAGRRCVAGVARAIGALLVLAAVLAGIPALLLAVAPMGPPTALPSWAEVGTAVTSPDRGQLLLGALTVAAWVCWFVFALSAVVEILAVARGLPTPRLPGLGMAQGAAAALVAGAAVLLAPAQLPAARPPAPVAATATTAPAAVAPRPADISRAPSVNVAAPAIAVPVAGNAAPRPHAAPKRAYPTVTVRRGDTLWQLAEHHLGSGTRFREIADLNYGRTQPDGAHLSDAHRIYPGWILRLPHHATGTATRADNDDGRTRRTADGPSATEPRTASQHASTGNDQHARTGEVAESRRTYLVRAGDTLWDIAQTHLGDGTRYRDLLALNAGRPQPDGQSLHDPALILPGWHLLLPPRHAHHDADTRPKHRQPAPSRSDTVEVPEPGPAPAPTAATSTGPRSPHPVATATSRELIPEPQLPHRLLAPLSARPDASPTHVPVPAVVDADDPAPALVGLLTVGVTALAAAGIITELARRRRHQQRRRPTGTRIALPAPDSAAHAAERALRVDMDTPTLDLLRAALARIACQHVATGAVPPRIALMMVNPEQIDLTLEPNSEAIAAAMTPFTRSDTGAWTATRAELLNGPDTDTERAGADPVYPALVTLGVTEDAVVLVNLEAAGTLSVQPDTDQALPVLRALAFELATSPLAATCSLSVSPELADLAAVTDPSRLRTQDPAAMAAGLHARTTSAARDDVDLIAVRAGGVPDAGGVQIYLSVTEAVGLQTDPWSGCATIVATTATTGAGNSGWSLHLDGDQARLKPYGLELQPQRLAEATYRGLLDLLSITTEPAQAPPLPPEPALTPEREPRSIQLQGTPAAVAEAGPQRQVTISEVPICAPPRVHVLGAVRIEAAGGRSDNRKRRITELITYLALHPDTPAAALDDVLWNGRRVSRETRNSLVYRARAWLGDAPDGTPYLPHAGESGRYRLHPALTCDWHDFQRHIHNATTAHHDVNKVVELQAALDLVQDRPFLGVDPAGYTWAEHDTQAMISAIVDTAHQLATLRLQAGDTRGAQDAAAHGLFVDPVSELLYRDAITAAQARSDVQECQRLEQQLRARLDDFDPDVDLEPETLELLTALAATR